MRIQKFLRDQGLGSIRKCDEFVEKGEIFVNNAPLNEPTYYLKEGDQVKFRGKSYKFSTENPEKHLYLKFNKPVEVLSSKSDKFGRRLVYDYLKDVKTSKPLFYGGRLDFLSRGLMIFSTDGDFINRLSHPSFGITKEYIVTAEKNLDFGAIEKLSSGFSFEGVKYSPFTFSRLSNKKVKIILNEGKKQEVRIIIKNSGNIVRDLLRTRIGEYKLENLPEGNYLMI